MNRFLWILLLVTRAPALPAQTPPDTTEEAAARQLRERIRQRWNERVRQDLKLTNDQAAKLQGTEDRFMQRRRDLAERQRTINEALRGQLQPGVAANSDSVRKLMEARERNRAAVAQLDQDEDSEISGYLNPVQHARYQMMREQLRRRIQEIRRERMPERMRRPPAERGRMRPRPGPEQRPPPERRP